MPRELLDFMETFELPPGADLAAFLRDFDTVMNRRGTADDPEHVEVIREVDGWRVQAGVWTPPGASALPVILHFHGGGWISGNHLTHRSLDATLSRLGYVVVSIDYRRAPRHRFPAALEDCVAALAWCRENAARLGGDPSRIALMGDSAGANLAASVIAGAGPEACRLGILLYGIFDYHQALPLLGVILGGTEPETQALLLPEEFEALRGDPRLSPLHAQTQWPPLYLAVGQRDPLLPQSEAMHEKLTSAGSPHVFDVIPGAAHSYAQLPADPPSKAGLERLISYLVEHPW